MAKRKPKVESVVGLEKLIPETKITFIKRSPDPKTALSQNWIKANRETYQGRWVALDGDRILADASSSTELAKIIDITDGKRKFITLIY